MNRKFQSLDLNLNMDGAASIDSSGYSGMHGPTNYWQNYQIMKHKASWLYGNNSWSRRTSDASSFISNAQEIEDLYCDDEISPNLETDPNMMLTAYLRENMGNNNPDINFPEKPCLTDRGKNTLFEIFIFCPKIQLSFPEKIVDFFGRKTRENVVVLDFLAVDNFDFTRKIVKKFEVKNT